MSKKSYISPSMQILCFENLSLQRKQQVLVTSVVTSVVSDDLGYKEEEFKEEDEDL